jgi:hypothetical protein
MHMSSRRAVKKALLLLQQALTTWRVTWRLLVQRIGSLPSLSLLSLVCIIVALF